MSELIDVANGLYFGYVSQQGRIKFIIFLETFFNLYEVPLKSKKTGLAHRYLKKTTKLQNEKQNTYIEYRPSNLHTGFKQISLIENINWALRMRFTIHTGKKETPFELRLGRKLKAGLTNTVNSSKRYLPDWISVTRKRIAFRRAKTRQGRYEQDCND